MEKEDKLVSVVIPCYNSEKWIKQTLNSVFNQTYNNIEVIVIDDGSVDNTKKIVDEYPGNITYIHQKNKGPSAARNLGISLSKGYYIALLDSDDLWINSKIEEQISIFKKNSEIALSISNVKVVTEDLDYLYTNFNKVNSDRHKLLRDLFLGKITMNTPTIMFKKEILSTVKGFDESLKMREDHFFLMDVVSKYEIHHTTKPLVLRRINSESISHSFDLDSTLELFEPFIKKSIIKYPQLKKYIKDVYASLFFSIAIKYWKDQQKLLANNYMTKAYNYKKVNTRILFYIIIIKLKINYDIYMLFRKKLGEFKSIIKLEIR